MEVENLVRLSLNVLVLRYKAFHSVPVLRSRMDNKRLESKNLIGYESTFCQKFRKLKSNNLFLLLDKNCHTLPHTVSKFFLLP